MQICRIEDRKMINTKVLNNIFVILMISTLFLLLSLGALKMYYDNKIREVENSYVQEIQTLKNDKLAAVKSYNTVNSLYIEEKRLATERKSELTTAQTELENLKSQIYLSKQREKQVSRGDYANKDLSQYEIFTIDEFNQWIEDRAPEDSPFRGKGEFFLKLAAELHQDPKFLVALAAQESGWGNSNIAKDKNNYYGIGAFNATPYDSSLHFGDGIESGLAEGANWIKVNYYDQGQKTLNLMIYGDKAYCVDDNGVPSQTWIDGITNIIYK